jgi:hypothetical protein
MRVRRVPPDHFLSRFPRCRPLKAYHGAVQLAKQGTMPAPDPRVGFGKGRRGVGGAVGFYPSGATGRTGHDAAAVAVRAGLAGRDRNADRLWRGAAGDRGVPGERRGRGAGCARGDQAAPARPTTVRAGGWAVGAVGRQRRALRGPGASARGHGPGATARARHPGTADGAGLPGGFRRGGAAAVAGRRRAASSPARASACRGWPRPAVD